jgi:hypothetical protein
MIQEDKKFIVKENVNLQRDSYSKGIINTDLAALNDYKQKRKMLSEVNTNSERIAKLENDIGDIKNMLVQLLKDRV